MTSARPVRVVAGVVLAVLLGACTSGGTPGTAPAPRTAAVPGDGTKYARAVDAAVARHLTVWLEADLVRRWHDGGSSLDQAAATLAALGRRRGVAGVKIADELGQDDGLNSRDEVLAFLRAASTAVRHALPGTKILVDMVVPELGCMPGVPAVATQSASCAAAARSHWPGASVEVATAVVDSGYVDVLDLSTGLRDDGEYAAWGTDRDTAQQAAWTAVARLGWARHVRLQARKALAQVGGYRGDAGQAAAQLRTWVDIPLERGAQAVDVWTWRQPYRGGTAMLLDSGLRSNALWRGLLDRPADRSKLVTHFTPSSTELGLSEDLDRLAQAFGTVFIAAGTG